APYPKIIGESKTDPNPAHPSRLAPILLRDLSILAVKGCRRTCTTLRKRFTLDRHNVAIGRVRRLLAVATPRVGHVMQSHVEVSDAGSVLLFGKALLRHRRCEAFFFPRSHGVRDGPTRKCIVHRTRTHDAWHAADTGLGHRLDALPNERPNRVHFLAIFC